MLAILSLLLPGLLVQLHLPAAAAAAAAAAAQPAANVASDIPRNDLDPTGGYLSSPPAYPYSTCGIPSQVASVPAFTLVNGRTEYTLANFAVPRLNKTLIQRVKSAAQARLPSSVRSSIASMRSVHSASGIIHPGSGAGAVELALLLSRLSSGSAVQLAAKSTLIDGTGVLPKNRAANGGGVWAPPTNCPVTGYQSAGSLAMPNMQVRYSGINAAGINCSAAYDARAPTTICGHISFVEMDAQMVYKMALAWYATGDSRYASQVLSIVNAWAAINKDWGWHWENGPLEAGWGIAAMARALELVRSRDTTGVIPRFISWVNKVPMQDMLYYTVNLTSKNLPNQYGNWHSTLAEAYMALGVLGNNRTMYNSGVSLFTSTVADYLKWGRGSFAVQYGTTSRLPGECSETMRDFFHTQFGLGGLLQAAEIAWQQDDDLYSASNYALPAAMELHARVVNAFAANRSSALLPPTFKYYATDMPAAPAGCSWRFDVARQLWQAVWTANGTLNFELRDGNKYMLGIGFLPTGWEMGYNHYVGRLGMRLPETAALLARSWPEWQEFHWGSGTLTHAETAQPLWRTGVTSTAICNKATTTVRAAAAPAAGISSIAAESAVARPAAAAVSEPATVAQVQQEQCQQQQQPFLSQRLQ
ncbi:chondroitin AC/alginate lyase [Scenedesmus sp. NREL 46B-D3]|nr:chondroitin AC/alginate lyase [Scenedesmus sp. NREL 46B-D3]